MNRETIALTREQLQLTAACVLTSLKNHKESMSRTERAALKEVLILLHTKYHKLEKGK